MEGFREWLDEERARRTHNLLCAVPEFERFTCSAVFSFGAWVRSKIRKLRTVVVCQERKISTDWREEQGNARTKADETLHLRDECNVSEVDCAV